MTADSLSNRLDAEMNRQRRLPVVRSCRESWRLRRWHLSIQCFQQRPQSKAGDTLHTDVERVGAEVGYWLGHEFWDRGIGDGGRSRPERVWVSNPPRASPALRRPVRRQRRLRARAPGGRGRRRVMIDRRPTQAASPA